MYTYEERLTLWEAAIIEDALKLAESESRDYARENQCSYLEFCQAYAMDAEIGLSAIELFSLLRDSPLDPAEYLTRFFDTGTEYQS